MTSMEMDVSEVFHAFDELLQDNLSRIEVRLERSREFEIIGGGRTGPVGGHRAQT